MSLHAKIVWLFIGVAIVPLLILAGYSHYQSLVLVERAAEARLTAEVMAASDFLARESAAAAAALRGAVGMVSAGDGVEGPLQSAAEEVPASFERFEYVGVFGPSGEPLARFGRVPRDTVRCGPGGRSTLVRKEISVGPTGATAVGGYWLGETLDQTSAPGVSVWDRRGRLLFSDTCVAGSELAATDLPAGGPTPGFYELEGGRYGAGASVGDEPWTAVVTARNTIGEPIGALFRNYWLFVLVLASTTALAFSVFLGRVTRSIEDLTRAAERVGEGDLRPWLPPPATDEVGRLTLAFSRMTDRLRETLERVDRSGRLAVVGKLSSYLAHEIRNPLSSVKMNLQRLQRWERDGQLPPKCHEPIEMSLKEVDRLSVAVSNVLQLSRPRDTPPEVVGLHEIVTEAGHLLDNELARRGVELRWELDAEADRILARPGQIKGVVINLMLNAIDAQPDGGRLVIRSKLVPGPDGDHGPRLELRFRDDGPGVPNEIRDRIFEPFFTTKQNGSGIGLAVASQAVRDNGGDLFLEEPFSLDQGAEFVMSFPLAAVSSEEPAHAAEPKLAPWMEEGGRGTRRPGDDTGKRAG